MSRLREQGIEVGWDEKTDTPFSLRGKGLGTWALEGQPGRNVFEGSYADRALAVMANLAPVFGIRDVRQELQPSEPVQLDDLGFRHQRLGQRYQGLSVVGGDLKVHFNAQGVPYEVNGRFVPGIELDVRPQISAGQSEASAKEVFTADAMDLQGLRIHEPPSLVVLAVEQDPVLAYQLAISSTPAHSWKYWVDAKSGQVVRKITQVCGIQAPSARGTSVQLRGMRLPNEGGAYVTFPGWRESVKINETNNMTAYYMNDPNSYTYVFNCNNTTNIINNTNNITNDYGTFAYQTGNNWANNDPAKVSVAANMVTIMSYYKSVHNRRSADGQGTVVPAYVHYDKNLGNAFFNANEKAMFFGDGDTNSYAWGVLDMAAHELTHGVTFFTAKLEYQNGSGALSESFSDIFGANIEFYGQVDTQSRYPEKVLGTADWMIAEDLVRNGVCLRDMRNPANTNTSEFLRFSGSSFWNGLQPSRYKGANWKNYTNNPSSEENDSGWVHVNSGVQNHFYYLLCQGGKGTNDGIVYNLAGIGINNARQIAYRALTVYCTQYTDYPGARAAWLSAANDLNAAWAGPVAAAWDAVGVSGAGVGAGSGGPTGGLPASFATAENLSGRFFNATVGGSRITSSGQTFWWKWTAPSTGRLRLDTSRSTAGADTVLQVSAFSNNVVTNSSTRVITTNSVLQTPVLYSNDNQSASVRWSQLDFGVTQGQNLAFAVSGLQAGQDLVLSGVLAAQNGPPNDAFASALVKTGTRWSERGSTLNGSAETGEPAHAGSAATSSVWFSWTAPDNRTVTLSTAGSTGDTLLAVYNGNTVNALTRVASNDDLTRADKTSQVRFSANQGTTYRIAVDSKNGQTGPYVLELR